MESLTFQCSKKAWVRTCRQLKPKGQFRDTAPAFVWAEGDMAHIDLDGADGAFKATVSSAGEVVLPAALFVKIAGLSEDLPGESISFTAEPGRVRMGDVEYSSSDIRLNPPSIRRVPMPPMGAPLPSILALGYQYSDEELEASGCMPLLKQAQAEAENRIAKAAGLLGALGVEPAELRKIVEEHVRREAASRP